MCESEKKYPILFRVSHRTLKHAQSIDNETSDMYRGYTKNRGQSKKKSTEIRLFEVGAWVGPLIS